MGLVSGQWFDSEELAEIQGDDFFDNESPGESLGSRQGRGFHQTPWSAAVGAEAREVAEEMESAWRSRSN